MRWRRALLITVLLQGLMTPGGGIGTANLTPPGQPCYCLTAAGARVDGYVIASRFTDVPSVVK